ncbi:MAG: NUDIX domain-containing protein [Gemmatimonadaceae bacterium]
MGNPVELRIGAVEVYPLRRRSDAWELLLLQRAATARCPRSWEVVSGRIEQGERPEDAALRELREETGLEAERLYNVTVTSFYLHRASTVMMSVVFAAVVRDARLSLGAEHSAAEWLPATAAPARMSWPRSRALFSDICQLLGHGDAGDLEDVLRVK